MKLDKFINRPVLSTVISILIVILGVIGLATLPVTQYPDIAPPTVSVRATYTGANAQTVLNSVIAPLEDQINGVENMMYIQSSASNNGSAEISVYFNQGTDPDMAAVNVQNRVSMAQGLLPAEVTKVGVTTQKRQNSMLLIFSLYDAEDKYNIEFIENYAKINLIPEVQRVKGVGDANVMGQDYSMRIWLKPDVMAQYNLVPSDISGVLAEQNIEAAPGQFGERGNQTFQYTIRYKGRLQQTEEFEDIVVKALPNGEVLRLGDVARIELGRLAYTFNNTVNGHKAVTCIVFQMAGTNATETINNLLDVISKAEESLPAGLKINVAQNANDFLYASIHEVIKTLIEAFVLVFIVVYVFLQDMRSTLIPAIATSCNSYFCWGLFRMFGDRKYGSPQNAITVWKDHMVSQGFGYKLGVDLPGEKRGLIPNAQFYDKAYRGHWNGLTVISISIGQGEILSTPLQIANLGATIANRGYFVTPHIVKEIQDNQLDSIYRVPRYTTIEKRHYESVVEGMRGAATGGTCRMLSVMVPDLEACGKTGTAQNRGHDHSVFMGFAPMNKPKIAIAVYVENGGWGATYGVPFGALMMEQYLKGKLSPENELRAEEFSNRVILYGNEER